MNNEIILIRVTQILRSHTYIFVVDTSLDLHITSWRSSAELVADVQNEKVSSHNDTTVLFRIEVHSKIFDNLLPFLATPLAPRYCLRLKHRVLINFIFDIFMHQFDCAVLALAML